MRRHLPGTFVAHRLNDRAWRLSRSEPAPIDVFMRGAEAAAAEVFRPQSIRDIEIEWRADAVIMTMTAADHARTVRSQSVLVHEPQAGLYECLELPNLDADTRRFWRRVFRVARVPGGRFLLRFLAQRTRNRG